MTPSAIEQGELVAARLGRGSDYGPQNTRTATFQNGDASAAGRRTLARMFAIIHALEEARNGLGVAELGLRVGVPRSTVHGLLAAMRAEGFVEIVPSTGRVCLGSWMLRLSAAASEYEVRESNIEVEIATPAWTAEALQLPATAAAPSAL